MRQLEPNEVIVTWVREALPTQRGVHRRVYLVDAEAGTYSKCLSHAKRYTPPEALEAIKVLRAVYPHIQVTFVQMLGFLPESEERIPRPPHAAPARSKG